MDTQGKPITHDKLVVMDDLMQDHPFKIDVVYAQANHPENLFGQALYAPDAKLILHKYLAEIVVAAAHYARDRHGATFVLMDGLRPVEAQQAMQETPIVQRNPHWCEGPSRLLSPPGKGGHPRGMAIDVVLEDENGDRIDMGTPFDYLSEDRDNNPAARHYEGFSEAIQRNRKMLETCMMDAAKDYARDLLPLPAEWWDFRFKAGFYNDYAPVHDKDLPEHLRMMPKT